MKKLFDYLKDITFIEVLVILAIISFGIAGLKSIKAKPKTNLQVEVEKMERRKEELTTQISNLEARRLTFRDELQNLRQEQISLKRAVELEKITQAAQTNNYHTQFVNIAIEFKVVRD